MSIPFYTNDNQQFLTDDLLHFHVLGGEDFIIKLYKNTAEKKRVDKTNYLTLVHTVSGALREETSIVNPVIRFELVDVPEFNYVEIPKFNRFYFVNDVRSIVNNLWEIDMTVDVLMSYKDAVTELNGFIDRNEFKYDDAIIDKKRVIRQGYHVDEWNIDNSLFIPSNGFFAITGFGIYASEVE